MAARLKQRLALGRARAASTADVEPASIGGVVACEPHVLDSPLASLLGPGAVIGAHALIWAGPLSVRRRAEWLPRAAFLAVDTLVLAKRAGP